MLDVQPLPFDLAALDDIVGQRLKNSLLLELKPQCFHLAEQATLPVTAGGQYGGEVDRVPPEIPDGA